MRAVIATLIITFMFAASLGTTPVTSPVHTPAPTAATGYRVHTDYSGLTPYNPEPEMYTRLSPGPLPELVPSDSYGPLLPYVGAQAIADFEGPVSIPKYGLVTTGGMIVTDAVFEHIYAEYNQSRTQSVYTFLSAAHGDGSDAAVSACATDGSWCLPFDYIDVSPRDSVIVAYIGYNYSDGGGERTDADVYDYSGRLLYSLHDLPYFDVIDRQVSWYGPMLYGSGDIAFARLTTGELGYVDMATGELTLMDFEDAEPFYGGRAAVCVDGLWGYIDTNFNFIVSPQYLWADDYSDGCAMVTKQDGEDVYMTRDFSEAPSEIDGNKVFYEGGGWFSYEYPGGTTVIAPDGARHELPGVASVSEICEGLIICRNEDNCFSVMTPDGVEIIPFSKGHSWIYAKSGMHSPLLFYTYLDGYITVYYSDGTLRLRTKGRITENKHGLLGILSRDEFRYVNLQGDTVFRVSLLASLPD